MPPSGFDGVAPGFNRYRGLPDGVAGAIRAAVLDNLGGGRPEVLDLGAGTGRIGSVFVAARDAYVGVDLSFGMLAEFSRRQAPEWNPPRLVQADGRALPFPNATFDAVLLIQVFGGMREWRAVLAEARRVLRPVGALILGRSIAPAGGVDAAMKEQLARVLDEMAAPPPGRNTRDEAERWLAAEAAEIRRVFAADWTAERTARRFLERHRSGARFSALPDQVKDEALQKLAAWAAQEFGSLDAAFAERHEFELNIYRFGEEAGG